METGKDKGPKVHSFGWWPEAVGVVGVAALLWFLIAFATGIM